MQLQSCCTVNLMYIYFLMSCCILLQSLIFARLSNCINKVVNRLELLLNQPRIFCEERKAKFPKLSLGKECQIKSYGIVKCNTKKDRIH